MFTVTRSEYNPILSPNEDHPWEAAAAYNGCPVVIGKKTYLVYRALSEPQLLKEPRIRMSTIGRAISKDGKHYEDRMALVKPDMDFDKYGCEDPRVTKIGKSYYIVYTALGGFPFSADNIKVAVAISDDLETVREKHLVTPFNAKGMAFFPEKINGKYAAILTVNTDNPPSDICYAEADRMEDFWSPEYWKEWMKKLDAHKISIRRLSSDHLEMGAVRPDRQRMALGLFAYSTVWPKRPGIRRRSYPPRPGKSSHGRGTDERPIHGAGSILRADWTGTAYHIPYRSTHPQRKTRRRHSGDLLRRGRHFLRYGHYSVSIISSQPDRRRRKDDQAFPG